MRKPAAAERACGRVGRQVVRMRRNAGRRLAVLASVGYGHEGGAPSGLIKRLGGLVEPC